MRVAVFLLFLPLLALAGCGMASPFSGDFTVTEVGGGGGNPAGRVVNLAGVPVPGVTVTIRRAISDPLHRSTGYFYERAVTDALGRYAFTSGTPLMQVSATVYPDYPGYAGEPDFYGLTVGVASGYDFTLHKLVTVSGALLISDGVTVPAPVRVNFTRFGVVQRSTVSDEATGAFSAQLKEALEYLIDPRTTANFQFDPPQRSVIPGHDGTPGQDFALTRLAYGISGTVRRADGSPVWGRSVLATGSTGYRAGYTNTSGVYQIDGLAPDTYTVRLETGVTTPPSYVVQITDRDFQHLNFSFQ